MLDKLEFLDVSNNELPDDYFAQVQYSSFINFFKISNVSLSFFNNVEINRENIKVLDLSSNELTSFNFDNRYESISNLNISNNYFEFILSDQIELKDLVKAYSLKVSLEKSLTNVKNDILCFALHGRGQSWFSHSQTF